MRNAGRSARLGAAVAALLVVWLGLGWSQGHYWDEYFYLFSVSTHTPAELVRFEQHTVLFPVGFFSEKIGHVAFLRLLTQGFGQGEAVLYGIQVLYAVLLVGFVAAAYGLLRELLAERWARHSALVLLFSPLALYLTFKTLSEVPSLLFITLGSWAFVRSFARHSARHIGVCLGVAALALGVGMLCRVTAIVGFGGLGVALFVAGGERFDRRRVLVRLVGLTVAAAALQTAGLALAGGNLLGIGTHIHSVVADHRPLQRVYAFAFFVQALALVLPFAWRLRAERWVQVAAVWLAVSFLPFLAGHEPRYYAPAMIPLAVLTAAGLSEAARLLFDADLQFGWAILLAALTLVNRGLLVPLMPFEVDQAPLLALFHSLEARSPDASFLIPWTSDYSLLRFSFPAATIALTLSNTPVSREYQPGSAVSLSAADRWWAGSGHYVGSRAQLNRFPRPWRYIGWTFNPPAVRLQRLLGTVGLHPALAKAGGLHNHLAGSWVWLDPGLSWSSGYQLGQYHAYEIRPRPAAGSAPPR